MFNNHGEYHVLCHGIHYAMRMYTVVYGTSVETVIISLRAQAQSRQSAKLFLQSSELRLPHPSAAGACAPPPLVPGGRGTPASGKGVGESQFQRGDIHCGTLYLYVLCGHKVYEHWRSIDKFAQNLIVFI
jgi:hypothetical protein